MSAIKASIDSRSSQSERGRGRSAAGSGTSALLLLLAIAQPAPAVAQSAASDNRGLEEIVVSARKRDESLVSTPEAVTAFSAQQIEDLHIQSFIDYAAKTPNLSFAYGVADTGVFSRSIAIRGISGANTTAVYLDDTPISQAFDPRVLDIDRIEVLKGPQGSLFGADSMGGAVRLISTKPNTTENSFREMIQGGATSGGGSTDYGIQSGANLVVIPDVAALRAVVFYQHDAGFLTRTNPVGDHPGSSESVNDQGTETNYGFALTGLAHVMPNLDVTLRLFNQTTDLPKGWQATLAPLPQFEPASYIRSQPTDLQDLAYTQVWLPSLTVSYSGNHWNISSSTSYFDLRDHEVEASQVGTIQAFQSFFGVSPPPNIPPWYRQDHEWQFTQELRASFEEFHGLSGVVGVYYTNQHTQNLFPPLIYPGLTGLGIGATDDNFFNGDFRFRNEEEAVFGELNYAVTDHLTLTAGGREYRLNDKTYILSDGFINGGLLIANPPAEADRGFSPKIGAEYSLGDKGGPGNSGNVYVTWAKGFRPGGGNQPLPPQCDDALAAVGLTRDSALEYHPDTVKTTEIGAKADLSEHRVFGAVAAFQTDWNNIQQTINLPACGYQVHGNTGAGRIRGGEIELTARAATGLDLSVGVGYEDARITNAGNGAFVVGERLLEVPEVTATTRGTYRFPLSANLRGFLSADVSYTGNSLSANTTGSVPVVRPAYSLANARVGVEWPTSSLTLYLNNLGNTHANLADLRFLGFNEFTVNSAGQTVPLPRVVVSPPFQAGLQYRVRF